MNKQMIEQIYNSKYKCNVRAGDQICLLEDHFLAFDFPS